MAEQQPKRQYATSLETMQPWEKLSGTWETYNHDLPTMAIMVRGSVRRGADPEQLKIAWEEMRIDDPSLPETIDQFLEQYPQTSTPREGQQR